MRRQLWKLFPIVLIALMAQVFAPIGATWAASIAASDPLRGVPMCSGGAGSGAGQTDQSGQHRAHDGCCSTCSVLYTGAPVDGPQGTFTTPLRQLAQVVWLESAPDLFGSSAGSHAQARAPPSIS